MPLQKEKACKATAYKNIEYIIDPGKTVDDDWVKWVETQNMRTDGNGEAKDFAKEFREVNKQFGQNTEFNDRKYYHLVINFKSIPDVTPEMVMEVGKAYVAHYYPNHQAVMCVHLHGGRDDLKQEDLEFEGESNDGLHFHACINSVDMVTGKKVDRSDKDLAERKDMANTIAYEMYGIEPFDWRAAVKEARRRQKAEEKTGEADQYSQVEQDMHAAGRLSELDELRNKILRNAMMSRSRAEFEERMKADGVTMPRNTEKTVSFTYKEGKTGTVRGSRLGDQYTAEFIDKMIEYNIRTAQAARDPETHAPLMNFDHIDEIAKKKNYILAQGYGFTMSQPTFLRLSYSELSIRVAFAFVKRQNESGIGWRNGTLYFNGEPVRTDERLQRMYNAGLAAKECMEKYGCDRPYTLEQKSLELSNELEEIKTELRKQRKIETSYKNRLAQKQELVDALKMVRAGTGTPEEQNMARRRLYRHGIKKEEFGDPETMIRLLDEVKKASDELKQQSEKTKEVFYQQRDMQRGIDKIGNALAGLAEANNPRFYYGKDPDWRGTIAHEIDAWERKQAALEAGEPEQDPEEKPGPDFAATLQEAITRSKTLDEQKQREKGKDQEQDPTKPKPYDPYTN